MSTRKTSKARVGWLVCGLMLAGLASGKACGVSWKKPHLHFDGVDEYGHVEYWDQIGEMELGDGQEAFPLVIGFNSLWEHASPHLGQGWLLGLLDSYIYQTGENTFTMIQPDGWTLSFARDGKNPSILHGAKGWKAEIKQETITAYASCGWILTFVKGRITSISTPKNRVVEIKRNGDGGVREVVSGANVLLTVERDFDKNVVGLVMGDKRIGLEQVERPRVQNVQGQNVVSGMSRSIGKISLADGRTKNFTYGVDRKLQPTMNITESSSDERKITWDAATKQILSDGEWTYDIKPAEIAWHNAAIGRTNEKGQKEFWHYDQAKGEEINTTANGATKVKTWFTSGGLNGKVRESKVAYNGVPYSVTKRMYDDGGRLLRISGRMNNKTNSIKRVSRITTDGEYFTGTYYLSDGKTFLVIKNSGDRKPARSEESKSQFFQELKGFVGAHAGKGFDNVREFDRDSNLISIQQNGAIVKFIDQGKVLREIWKNNICRGLVFGVGSSTDLVYAKLTTSGFIDTLTDLNQNEISDPNVIRESSAIVVRHLSEIKVSEKISSR